MDEEFVENFEKCLSICKKILLSKGYSEIGCLDKLESFQKDYLEERNLEEENNMRKQFRKIISEIDHETTKTTPNYDKNAYEAKNCWKENEKIVNIKKNKWDIEIRVRIRHNK